MRVARCYARGRRRRYRHHHQALGPGMRPTFHLTLLLLGGVFGEGRERESRRAEQRWPLPPSSSLLFRPLHLPPSSPTSPGDHSISGPRAEEGESAQPRSRRRRKKISVLFVEKAHMEFLCICLCTRWKTKETQGLQTFRIRHCKTGAWPSLGVWISIVYS